MTKHADIVKDYVEKQEEKRSRYTFEIFAAIHKRRTDSFPLPGEKRWHWRFRCNSNGHIMFNGQPRGYVTKRNCINAIRACERALESPIKHEIQEVER